MLPLRRRAEASFAVGERRAQCGPVVVRIAEQQFHCAAAAPRRRAGDLQAMRGRELQRAGGDVVVAGDGDVAGEERGMTGALDEQPVVARRNAADTEVAIPVRRRRDPVVHHKRETRPRYVRPWRANVREGKRLAGGGVDDRADDGAAAVELDPAEVDELAGLNLAAGNLLRGET